MDPITGEALDNWFAFHPATETTGPAHDAVRAACRTCAQVIAGACPPGADRSAAIRHLREAMFTANAAIACGSR